MAVYLFLCTSCRIKKLINRTYFLNSPLYLYFGMKQTLTHIIIQQVFRQVLNWMTYIRMVRRAGKYILVNLLFSITNCHAIPVRKLTSCMLTTSTQAFFTVSLSCHSPIGFPLPIRRCTHNNVTRKFVLLTTRKLMQLYITIFAVYIHTVLTVASCRM